MSTEKGKLPDYHQLLVTHRYYFPAVVAVVASVALIFFSFSNVSAVFETGEMIDKSESELEEANRKLARYGQLQSGELGEIQATIGEVLPVEKPVFQALSVLRGLAQDHDVIISDLSTKPGSLATPSAEPVAGVGGNRAKNARGTVARNSQFESIGVTLEIRGAFSAIDTFLNKLTEVAPLVDVSEVRISSRRNANVSESFFQGELDLLVYWKPHDDEGGNKTVVVDEIGQAKRDIVSEVASYKTARSFSQTESVPLGI